MDKKILIITTIVVLTVGITYLLFKAKKSNEMNEKSNDEPENVIEMPVDTHDMESELKETKYRSAQTVYERHTEAAEIMTDAFSNIMKEVQPVEIEKKSEEPVIDTQDVEVVKELDSLSDELDELLK